jgi:polyisoprenoid-binding protein YceI
MKKTLIIIIVIGLLGFGAFAYLTRPVAAPTESVQSVSETLNPLSSRTTVYRISQKDSYVTFTLGEELRKVPTVVVGTTTEIAGDLAITDSHIDVGAIKIDARTFVTESEKRNDTINRRLLKSGDAGNEYITLKSASSDFQGTIVPGKSVSFNITGDLFIAGVTKFAVFKVTAIVLGDKLVGTAQTKVKLADFDIKIPTLDFIANVDEDVLVNINISADKVQ